MASITTSFAFLLWIRFSKIHLNPKGGTSFEGFSFIFLIKIVIKLQVQNREQYLVELVFFLQYVPFVI
jgi:hypothetical protein